MVGMSELTDAWLVHLRERERSPHTIATYARTLRSLEATCNPDTATREEVEAWWASRTDKATATRALIEASGQFALSVMRRCQ